MSQRNSSKWLLLVLFATLQGCTFGAYGTFPAPAAEETEQNKTTEEANPNPETTSNPTLTIAQKYAPIFLTEAKRYNIPLQVDFDNDWEASNNSQNYNELLETNLNFIQEPYAGEAILEPTIYYELLETETHYYLTYFLFFPHDAGDYHTFEPGDPRGGHNNDATSLFMIVDKASDFFFLLTLHHEELNIHEKTATRLYDDRPMVELTSGNHSLNGMAADVFLSEEADEDRRNLFYYHHGEEGENYQLLRIYDTLWPERKNDAIFGKFFEGVGTQFKGEHAPWAPWSRPFVPNQALIPEEERRTLAQSFFAPAALFCESFAISPCSLEYLENPYAEK